MLLGQILLRYQQIGLFVFLVIGLYRLTVSSLVMLGAWHVKVYQFSLMFPALLDYGIISTTISSAEPRNLWNAFCGSTYLISLDKLLMRNGKSSVFSNISTNLFPFITSLYLLHRLRKPMSGLSGMTLFTLFLPIILRRFWSLCVSTVVCLKKPKPEELCMFSTFQPSPEAINTEKKGGGKEEIVGEKQYIQI